MPGVSGVEAASASLTRYVSWQLEVLFNDLLDAVQLVQSYLEEVGIEVELKIQEYGAYQATTGQGKYESLAMGPYGVA
jgi:ABC-type transport system substrate-binding protein